MLTNAERRLLLAADRHGPFERHSNGDILLSGAIVLRGDDYVLAFTRLSSLGFLFQSRVETTGKASRYAISDLGRKVLRSRTRSC